MSKNRKTRMGLDVVPLDFGNITSPIDAIESHPTMIGSDFYIHGRKKTEGLELQAQRLRAEFSQKNQQKKEQPEKPEEKEEKSTMEGIEDTVKEFTTKIKNAEYSGKDIVISFVALTLIFTAYELMKK